MAKERLWSDLVGKDLSGFKILQVTEVYRVDEDGRKSESLGVFEDAEMAESFANNQPDGASWHKTAPMVVLTDGKMTFALGDRVMLRKGKKEKAYLRKVVLAKLTPAERRLLRIEK